MATVSISFISYKWCFYKQCTLLEEAFYHRNTLNETVFSSIYICVCVSVCGSLHFGLSLFQLFRISKFTKWNPLPSSVSG